MKLYITPNSLKGTVKIIASKSLSHRYLIAASLTSGASEIDNLMVSDDIFATKAALRQLGAKIDEPLIKGPLNLKEAITIDAYASGSTLRFLIPIAYLFNQFVTFIGRDRLPKRSLKVYETLFKQEGLLYEKLSHDELPLKIKGPLNASHFKIKGDVSSQFISGLLFAASCLKNDTSIEIIPPFESKPYVDLTVETLKDFNISITEEPLRYTIKGNQTFKPVRKTIEGDYSQAAFFIVAALIGEHPLVIKGLNEHSLQGDKAILEIVKAMGGSFNFNQGDLTVYPSLTHSTTISLKNIPDLGPILMILAALSKGTTIFKDINRLRIKESDRILAMEETLKKLGVPFKTFKDSMHVRGIKSFKVSNPFDSFHDHRIVMSLMVASIKANQTIEITHAEAINKSYPTFFDEWLKLGAIIKVR